MRGLFGEEMRVFLTRAGVGVAELQSLVGEDLASRTLRML